MGSRAGAVRQGRGGLSGLPRGFSGATAIMRALRAVAVLALALAVLLPEPCVAARWQLLGNSSNSLDKIYIDADSIRQLGGYRIAMVMTAYVAPRTNAHNITLDRHIQKTAFDCNNKLFYGIQTIGYLGDKQVGSGPEELDWKNKLVPVPDEPFAQRILALACGLPAAAPFASGGAASGQPPAPPQVKLSSGSGIIINDEGYALTNVHVINGCKAVVVKPFNADPLAVMVEAVDPKNDLALLKAATAYGKPASFRTLSSPPKLGESIGVIGYPLPGLLSTEPKATFGQVNSVAGMGNDYTLLQISAPVQGGNSGGPVFDESGHVIGVVVSQVSAAAISRIGNVPQNINFAIRGEIAQIFMQAHGIKFHTSESHKVLATEAIAAAGEESAVQVICSHE